MNNTVTTGPRWRGRTWTIGALLLTVLVLLVAACGDDDNGAAEDISGTAECDAEPAIFTTDDGVEFVRTPDSCFEDLPDFPYEPQYVEIDGMRQAYVDEGPDDGEVVLLLHGQPSWSYLYRDMIPVLADAGYRVIAMDHLGMGRSDKPIDIEDYSYVGHADRLERFVDELGLTDINMFVQDWGSLIGLKVAGENPDLFATIAVGDGALPPTPEGVQPFPEVENPDEPTDLTLPYGLIPDQQVPFYDGCELLLPREDNSYFGDWMAYAMTAESFTPSEVVEAMTWYDLTTEEEAAYDAPFPSRTYMAGPRVFPSLVNELGGNTIAAWNGLTSFEKPFLTLWASNDPGQLGSCEAQQTLIDNIHGAAGQPHDRLPEASHFLQDDQGTEIATRLVDWYGNLDEEPAGTSQGEERVGYEVLQIQDDGTIWAWIANTMTQEQFDALRLPAGWLKNQPREGVPDASTFNGSPGADGVLVEEEHFGFEWFHSATITSMGTTLDDEGLIRATTVEKDHEVSFNPGSMLTLLVSPTDKVYVMVSRDAGRTTDAPTVPEGWAIVERTVPDGFTARLSGETTVIRMDNEDSYQGPVTGLDTATLDSLDAAGFSGSGVGDEAADGSTPCS